MALGFMKKISPEYVVEHAIKDVKSTGIDGLKPYLTENAEKNGATIKNVSGGVSLLTGSNKVSVLLDKLADCNWTVVEILKGSESANAIVGFAIKTKSEEIEGTIRLTLIKEDKEWKIDGVEMPKFEKFTISSAD